MTGSNLRTCATQPKGVSPCKYFQVVLTATLTTNSSSGNRLDSPELQDQFGDAIRDAVEELACGVDRMCEFGE